LDPEPARLRKTPEIAFACPACGSEAVAGVDGVGSCRSCATAPRLEIPDGLKATHVVESCPACGNGLLYVQRDFNQKVGLGVVIVGAALAPFTPFYASLFVAAARRDRLLSLPGPHARVRAQPRAPRVRPAPGRAIFDSRRGLHDSQRSALKTEEGRGCGHNV
jgi:predicted RNA-binding Zn-ribbon protein involved in translation (DUF1610 family)